MRKLQVVMLQGVTGIETSANETGEEMGLLGRMALDRRVGKRVIMTRGFSPKKRSGAREGLQGAVDPRRARVA